MRQSLWKALLILLLVFSSAVGSAFLVYKAVGEETSVAAEGKARESFIANMGPTVDLGVFTVNLAGGSRYLRSEIVLEMSDRQSAEQIEQRLPQVRDQVLLILRHYSAEELVLPSTDSEVKYRITEAIDPLLTRGRVQGVYFTSWVIQ